MHAARQLWITLEPLHAVVYFAPEVRAAGKRIGLRGYWDTYFAFRAAPLGPVEAPPVAATFAGFDPEMVARALPSAWTRASVADCLATRASVSAAALRAAGVTDEQCAAAVELLSPVVLEQTGRPLGTANAALPLPEDPVAALWQLATTFREHRGDGHVAALLAAGLSGLDALLIQVSRGRFGDATMRGARGWSETAWDAARASLIYRGLLSQEGLTADGATAIAAVEDLTDERAWHEPDLVAEVVDVLAPAVASVWASGVLPEENPIGLPRS